MAAGEGASARDGRRASLAAEGLPDRGLLTRVAVMWIAAAVAAHGWYVFDRTRVNLTDGSRWPLGDDFINTWSGARLALHGRVGEIYDLAAFHAFQASVVGPDLQLYHYSYPPVTLLPTLPFALLPYVAALAAWTVAGLAAFVCALRTALPARTALLVGLATPAVLINDISGQTGLFTAALLGGGLGLLDRRPVTAGAMLGLLACKPQLALLVPFALAAGGRWRAFAAAAATALALVVASLAAFGPEPWADYAAQADLLRRGILEGAEGVWHRFASVFMAVRTLGAGVATAYAVQAAAAVCALAAVVLVWRSRAPRAVQGAVLVLGSFLATPYLQDYDLVVATFAVVWLLETDASRLAPAEARRMVALLGVMFVLPFFVASLARPSGVSFAAALIAVAFAAALWLWRRVPAEARGG
jgi:arabinofuranan 3-O-arabinosyltransferase